MWPFLASLFAALLVIQHLRFREAKRVAKADLQAERQKRAAVEEDQIRSIGQFDAQQQALFNSLLDGFLLLDKHGRIQSINRALEKLFGFTRDPRGKTIIEAFRLHELAELVERVKQEGQVRGFDLELPGFDARFLQVSAAAIVSSAKEYEGIIFIFNDLTKIRQLENTRKEFVANVSHELRTPLTLIKGFVETLLDGAKDDPEVSTRFLRMIEKHANRLTFLIEDLLTISSLESGRIVLNLHDVELRGLVDKIFEDLQSPARERKVSLLNQVPADMLVKGDADRLQQVLFNLVDNAIKYGRTSGRVSITAATKPEGWVDVRVSDDGPGIPEDSRDRVFERFYRVDKARSREQGGTGLGLSIVKHIVQSHGGEVWVESEVGKGSTFHFTLSPDGQAKTQASASAS